MDTLKKVSQKEAELIKELDGLMKKFDTIVRTLKNGKSTPDKEREIQSLHEKIKTIANKEQSLKLLGLPFANELCRFVDLGRTLIYASFRLNQDGMKKLKDGPKYIPVSKGYGAFTKEKKPSEKVFKESYDLVNFDLDAYEKLKKSCQLISKEVLEKVKKTPKTKAKNPSK